MHLSAGHTLSSYKILGPLGAGGMGEVYQALDIRLEREVAIKVLPADLASDPERRQRFEREARTLAMLNHPNVAGIHAVDEVDGVFYLALELVPGEDLAERLQCGVLPIDEAIDVARQIAEGLEAAHEAGVVHRDLKPANVRVTPEGVVKVLDFGLAKPTSPQAMAEAATSAQPDSFLLTAEGLVLGTPTYMSPEQARGKPVDRRTDIWAFGCVLFECLTGKRPFDGESMTDVLAAIVERQPDWDALPAETPAPVRELLRRCLHKDARQRLRDIGEARVLLEAGVFADPGEAVADRRSRAAPAVAALVVGAALGALAMWAVGTWAVGGESSPDTAQAPSAAREVRFEASVGDFQSAGAGSHLLGISPDGRYLAARFGRRLLLRSMDALESVVLMEDNAPSEISWSADSQEFAYFDDGLFRVSVAGGRPVQVSAATGLGPSGKVAWLDDGRFAHLDHADGECWVRTVLPSGEPGEDLAHLGEPGGGSLHFDGLAPLPGGRALTVAHDGPDHTLVAVDGREVHDLLVLNEAILDIHYVPSGHIVFLREEDGYWLLPFSLERLESTGPPVRILQDAASLSVSADGTLVYASVDGTAEKQLAWVDAEGEVAPFGRRHRDLRAPFLSHGGDAVFYFTGVRRESRLWRHDLERGVSTGCVRFEGEFAGGGFGRADGRLAYWVAKPSSDFAVTTYALADSGEGEPEVWRNELVTASSSDLRWALTSSFGTAAPGPLMLVDLETGEPTREFHPGPSMVTCLSPDDRWALVTAGKLPSQELYLAAFPQGEPSRRVSVDGVEPSGASFSADGSEIFYLGEEPRGLYRASLQTEPELKLGAPELVLKSVEGRELTPWTRGDGKFLAVQTTGDAETSWVVVVGWADQLGAK